jgi:hypothetical protein
MSDEIPVDMRSAMLADLVILEISEKNMLDQMDKDARRHKINHTKMRPLRTVLRGILLVLCIFAKPAWCVELATTIDNTCQEGSDGTQYNRSIIPLLNTGSVGIIATVLMLVITADFYYLWFITKESGTAKYTDDNKNLANGMLFVTLLHFLFDIMETNFAISFRLTDLTRAVFILLSMRPLRVNTLRLFKILSASREIILLFFINWLFFAGVARILFQMFADYYDDKYYYTYNFTTFQDTFFSLYVLMTTGNFPDALVKKIYPNRWVFLFYLIYTFLTIFIMINMLTGVLYFNYTNVVTQTIKEHQDDPEFKLIMKLCLKDGVITTERVKEILKLYAENPEMLKYKAALVNAKSGKMNEMMKYARLNEQKREHFTDHVWWRILFAVLDGALIVVALVMLEYNWFGQIMWQSIIIALAGVSFVDWILRIIGDGPGIGIKKFDN